MNKRLFILGCSVLLMTVVGLSQVAARGSSETGTSSGQTAAAANASGPTATATGGGQYTWNPEWYNASTASGVGIKTYHEAPSLDANVQSGKLPPVADRLPKDPLVIATYKNVGTYGGTLRVARMGPSDWGDMHRGKSAFLFQNDPSTGKTIPYLAAGYSLSDDSTVLTIKLRQGARWSDGQPFTTDDIMWYYNNIMLDPDVHYWTAGNWTFDGKMSTFKKVDDYTLQITFPKPISKVLLASRLNWTSTKQGYFFTPAHYMKQFDIHFNPNANAEAKKEGYESWVQLLTAHFDYGPPQRYTQPEMGPWVFTSVDAQAKHFVRNPYFWAVDQDGNQLPYVDNMEAQFFSDRQVAILSMMQGKVDIGGRLLNAEEFPLYKQNESTGGYTVLNWQETKMAATGFKFNLTDADPVKRRVFDDVRFRQAMSLAINRQAINQFVFLGLGTPQQYTIDSGASFFDPAWAKYMASFDKDKANQLLDQIGLKDVNGDNFREGPDGKPFIVNVLVSTESVLGSAGFKVAQLVSDDWQAVGVKTNLKQIAQELYETKAAANDLDVAIFPSEADLENRVNAAFAYDASGGAFGFAPLWQEWLDHKQWAANGSKGQEPSKGEQPPDSELKMIDTYNKYVNATNDADYQKYAKEFWSTFTQQLEMIGTVGKVPRPIIINNRLHNVPDVLPFAFETTLWRLAEPAQWYISQ